VFVFRPMQNKTSFRKCLALYGVHTCQSVTVFPQLCTLCCMSAWKRNPSGSQGKDGRGTDTYLPRLRGFTTAPALGRLTACFVGTGVGPTESMTLSPSSPARTNRHSHSLWQILSRLPNRFPNTALPAFARTEDNSVCSLATSADRPVYRSGVTTHKNTATKPQRQSRMFSRTVNAL
jgi:hypothetical protein